MQQLTRQSGGPERGFLAAWSWLFFSLTLGALFASLLSVNARAAEQHLLTPSTYEALSAVHELMDKQQYPQALKKLKALQEQVTGTDKGKAYEQAIILQTLGYLYSSMEDYPKAIQAFRDSLALKALPVQVTQDLRYTLAQLYIATEQYSEGVRFLEAWVKEAESPSAEAYVLLASAYYHLERYAEVLSPIMAAINLAKEPPEAWHQLHLSAHLELKQYPQAAQVLEALISRFPQKEQYWKQLAAVYLEINKEQRALAVQSLAARMESLTSEGLIYLSNLYRHLDIPYKAAQVLQRGLRTGAIEANTKNWERLANAWSAAREWEKAIDAFGEASQLSQDGKMDLRRGQLLIELRRWDGASVALQQALSKGGLDNPGQAQFLLGQVRYEQGRLADALKALKLAQQSSEYGQRAAQWIKHVKTLQEQKSSG